MKRREISTASRKCTEPNEREHGCSALKWAPGSLTRSKFARAEQKYLSGITIRNEFKHAFVTAEKRSPGTKFPQLI